MDKLKELYEQQQKIKNQVDNYSKQLQEFPQQANDLIDKRTQQSKAFIECNQKFNKYFKQLQDFNKTLTKQQQRDLVKYKRQLKFTHTTIS